MGNFVIEVKAVGGHGCQREVKSGEQVKPSCDSPFPACPDCLAREFVSRLQAICSVESAKLTHWPGQPSEVRDDLVSRVRDGQF